MRITMQALEGQTLADFDLADTTATDGNVYLYVDGVEYGSLWITETPNGPRFMLGQYDAGTECWEERNPLVSPVELT